MTTFKDPTRLFIEKFVAKGRRILLTVNRPDPHNNRFLTPEAITEINERWAGHFKTARAMLNELNVAEPHTDPWQPIADARRHDDTGKAIQYLGWCPEEPPDHIQIIWWEKTYNAWYSDSGVVAPALYQLQPEGPISHANVTTPRQALESNSSGNHQADDQKQDDGGPTRSE